jgi:hypothetical protein
MWVDSLEEFARRAQAVFVADPAHTRLTTVWRRARREWHLTVTDNATVRAGLRPFPPRVRASR